MSIFRITMRGQVTGAGASWFSFSWRATEPAAVPSASAQALADNFADILEENFVTVASTSWGVATYSAVFWPDTSPGSVPYPEIVAPLTDPPQGAANPPDLASRQTMLANFAAFANSGPTRKRMYIGRYTTGGNTSSGTPNGDIYTAVQAVASALLVPFAVGIELYYPAVLRIDPENQELISYNILTSAVVRQKWAFLRTRDSDHGI